MFKKIYFRKERYVLTNYDGDVSVLDTQHEDLEENETFLLFNCEFENLHDSIQLQEELYDIVRVLNEQDKELKGDD